MGIMSVSSRKRLTPEHTISHSPRFSDEHRDAEPTNVDIGGESDDAEGEEYGELEEDPGQWLGSSFAPLLLDVTVEISATGQFAKRLLVRRRLCH